MERKNDDSGFRCTTLSSAGFGPVQSSSHRAKVLHDTNDPGRAAKALLPQRPIRNLVLERLIKVDTLFIPFAFEDLHALHALGFTFVKDKQLDKIFERGDTNGDAVIDFEEFVKETPKTLRMSLVKLAKQNGHDLGFLA